MDCLPETGESDRIQNEVQKNLFIREIAGNDAEAAAQLCVELGYPASIDTMQRRIATVQTLPDHVVYVACLSGVVIGWIDVGIIHHLQSGPYGEIGGFVVSNAYRNQGIGQILLARAEQWVADRGVERVVVRSQIAREGAHRFYLREGYSRTKTSAVFSRNLRV